MENDINAYTPLSERIKQSALESVNKMFFPKIESYIFDWLVKKPGDCVKLIFSDLVNDIEVVSKSPLECVLKVPTIWQDELLPKLRREGMVIERDTTYVYYYIRLYPSNGTVSAKFIDTSTGNVVI